ncbi:hypothetical protein BDP27DRAFT_1189642, partial [Rhodocollybia butyracea]
LCDHLVPHIAAAGDTKKFKASVMSSAVELLNKQLRAGGKKKAAGVKQKISDMLAVYQTVHWLKHDGSGLGWTDEDGVTVTTPEDEAVWAGIVTSRPN